MKAVSVFAVCVAFVACAGTVRGAEITVSGAASLTNAFTDVKAAFEAAHPDIHVATNFAASNPLLQHMREGAPVDVFASADQDTMDRAGAEKLIDPATRRNFAANTLVLIVPVSGSGTAAISGLADLHMAERIAVGNPDSVPAGRYTRASLRAAGCWNALQPRMVLGESVRQVLGYVSRGEVDAGFVYATDAFIARDSVRIVDTMSGHDPILYPVAVAASARDKAAARAFVEYLFSPEGRAILAGYGFGEVR
ncbi:MAG: molybdate ABC transporter substrate-binding protein [Desulfovibrionaceae bacterium]|nr:molybdate ABC transporter substrate-binding protein [Desulfovibrionaceae bacterium]